MDLDEFMNLALLLLIGSTGGSIACCDDDGRKLSPRHLHSACFPIQIPSNDPVYSKKYQSCMSYVRSLPAFRSDCNFGPLEQVCKLFYFDIIKVLSIE